MRKETFIITLLVAVTLSAVVLAQASRGKEGWHDTFYQYRIPVVIDVKQAGWHVVPLPPTTIVDAVNSLEEMQFDSQLFAYNQCKAVETDENGKIVDLNPLAGYYLITESAELATDTITGQNQTMKIPTEKDAYYLVSFESEGASSAPTLNYEQIWPIGNSMRKHAYLSSYVPRMLPKKRMKHECLLLSDGQSMSLQVKTPYVTGTKTLSVKKARIVFLVNFAAPGKKHLMLYYQPMGAALYLAIPKNRRESLPAHAAALEKVGQGQKYNGNTRYLVGESEIFRLWFADTTVKLTPKTPVPVEKSAGVRIACAKNEAQSFQIVLTPKRSCEFKEIKISDLIGKKADLPAANSAVNAIEYVPIKRKSLWTQVTFLGEIADPLVAVQPKSIAATQGNSAWWVTVRVPAKTPAGDYTGHISIVYNDNKELRVPLTVHVHDFQLPEYSPFHTHMGGQFLAKTAGKDATITDYHGVKTKSDLKKLAHKYYDYMALHKFYPKSVALFSEVGMEWDAPPDGYNVDKPGNHFKLRDWDFTEFNNDLRHYIDDLKVNIVCLTHTNPSVCHIFKHLPGDELEQWELDPGHGTMGWQTFRQTTKVTWKKRPGDAYYDESIEVTQEQWDRLLLDYYRAIARNLEEHGWLDKFYILGDETSGTENLLHLIRLLKSDPLTAKIRFAQCLQSMEWLTHQEDGQYVFTKWFTYVPQLDENYNRWEEYFWDDYDVPRNRENLWSYAAYSSRLGIDVPGMTNREIGLEMFNRGGGGYFVWDTFVWAHIYGDSENPWLDPWTRLANGAISYFYPPRKHGMPAQPDFTITPSLRVQTYRESVDDYEYARILEELIAQADEKGIDTTEHKAIMTDIARYYPSPVEWSLNDAWYLELRDRMARAIEDLRNK